MAGNPTASRWYSTPDAARRRRPIELTLSDEERRALDELAEAGGESRSAVVGRLIAREHRRKARAPK
jgi:hypothetical protein